MMYLKIRGVNNFDKDNQYMDKESVGSVKTYGSIEWVHCTIWIVSKLKYMLV